MAGNVKLMTSAGGGVVLDTATTTATDVTVKVPVTGVNNGTLVCSDSSGNVGIGTSSPLAKIHVEGNASGAVQAFIKNANGGTNSSADLVFGVWSGTIPTGTSNPGPSAKISAINLNSADASTALAFSTYAASGSSAERMRIDSDGNLLVGTTTSSGTGITLASGKVIYSIGTYNNTTTAAANMGVGSGDGVFYRSTSSAKYKTDIEDISDEYVTNILKARPVWFRSLCAIDNPDWGYWGFVAEEVAEIDPRLVFWKTFELREVEKEVDGVKVVTQERVELDTPEAEGVQYDRFVPLLLKAIQKQETAIQELSAKNDALEARLSALEAK